MTDWRTVARTGLLTAILSGLLFVFFVKIGAGTVLHDPSFVFLQEARRDAPGMFTGIRLRWAARRGARADQPLANAGSRTPLQVAADRENVEFLRRAVAYSSQEHLRLVFDDACARGRDRVVEAVQEVVPELQCGQE